MDCFFRLAAAALPPVFVVSKPCWRSLKSSCALWRPSHMELHSGVAVFSRFTHVVRAVVAAAAAVFPLPCTLLPIPRSLYPHCVVPLPVLTRDRWHRFTHAHLQKHPVRAFPGSTMAP